MSDGYKFGNWYLILGSVIIASSIFYFGFTVATTQRYEIVSDGVFLDTKTGLICKGYERPADSEMYCFDIQNGPLTVDEEYWVDRPHTRRYTGYLNKREDEIKHMMDREKSRAEQEKAETQQRIDNALTSGCRFLTKTEKETRLPSEWERVKRELERVCGAPDNGERFAITCFLFTIDAKKSANVVNSEALKSLDRVMLCPNNREISVTLPGT